MPLSLDLTASLDGLADIVTCIQIGSAFQMQHCRYQPLDLPDALVQRYRQLPQALQHRYQCQKLRDYLYDIYFSREQTLAEEFADENQVLQNDSVRGLNRVFYQQIQNANRGEGYFDPGWQVTAVTPTNMRVQKQGLTLQIDPNAHLSAERKVEVGDMVAIRLPKNRLESGFYVAVGNAGLVPLEPSVELYFNVTPTGATMLLRQLTQALNERQIAFEFKVLYDPSNYGRCDAGTLHLERSSYPELVSLLQTCYQQTQSEFGVVTPLFTKPLAPGLGLAEVPQGELNDFGLHRCQLVAQGLLQAWHTGKNTPVQRLSYIEQAFIQNQIDLQMPYLNPGSTDIYLPLD